MYKDWDLQFRVLWLITDRPTNRLINRLIQGLRMSLHLFNFCWMFAKKLRTWPDVILVLLNYFLVGRWYFLYLYAA